MAKLYNIARMSCATVGTGTAVLVAAVSGYLTFANAGVSSGETVAYGIRDGAGSECGTGTYTLIGLTLTRSVTKSTNSDAAISLSGTAEVFIMARAEDLLNKADPLTSAQVAVQSDQETATSTTLAVTPGTQRHHPSAAKCWVVWGVTTTMDLNYGMTSVGDNGTGDWTLTPATAFSTANYVAVATCYTDTYGSGGWNGLSFSNATAKSASVIRVSSTRVFDIGGGSVNVGAFDSLKNHVVFFGDQ